MSAAEEEERLKQLCEVLVLFTFINIFVFFHSLLSLCDCVTVCVCVCGWMCVALLLGIVASPWRMRNILFCNYMRGGQTKICV